MAKTLAIVFVAFLAVFSYLKTTVYPLTAQTSFEVVNLLDSYSKPLNSTMGRQFLSKVHNSELGLCLNLSSNETQHATAVANASLALLHVMITDYITSRTTALHCAGSPKVKFSLVNATIANMSCLAGSSFADDFQIAQQSPYRLSDVLSLSVIDGNIGFVNLSQEESVLLEIPLTRLPNVSRPHMLMCVSRLLFASQWSSSHCSTNLTLGVANLKHFVQCNCSQLGYFAVFVHYSDLNAFSPWDLSYGGGNLSRNHGVANPTPYTGPYARLSLSLDGDCAILSNATRKADFLNSTKFSVALVLNISVVYVKEMTASCGSIVVNFTLLSPDGNRTTLNTELVKLSNIVVTDSFKVPVENSIVWPLTLGITANYNLTIPTNVLSQYYIRKTKTATTPTVPTEEVRPLVVDYSTLIITVSLALFLLVTCVCGTCCVHSWYLSKKKYTDFNSERVKPKKEEPVVEDVEAETPPEFPMTFTERSKVDERQMAKYDWARTSFAHEQNDVSAFLIGAAAEQPKLIVDCDSDDESDLATETNETTEQSESSDSLEYSSSEEDEELSENVANANEGEEKCGANLAQHDEKDGQESEAADKQGVKREPRGNGQENEEVFPTEDITHAEDRDNVVRPKLHARQNDNVPQNSEGIQGDENAHDDVTQDDTDTEDEEKDVGTSENQEDSSLNKGTSWKMSVKGGDTGMPEPSM